MCVVQVLRAIHHPCLKSRDARAFSNGDHLRSRIICGCFWGSLGSRGLFSVLYRNHCNDLRERLPNNSFQVRINPQSQQKPSLNQLYIQSDYFNVITSPIFTCRPGVGKRTSSIDLSRTQFMDWVRLNWVIKQNRTITGPIVLHPIRAAEVSP